MYRRVIAGALVAGLIMATAPAVARADGTGDAFSDGTQVGADAGKNDNSGGGASKGGSGGHSTCTYEKLDADSQAIADTIASNGSGPPRGKEPGAWYRKVCTDANGQSSATILWVTDRTVSPAQLAEQASDRAHIPLPDVHLNPPESGEQVVNLETWMWIDPSAWQPVAATASAGGITVTASAAPQSVRWAMGNGDVVTCVGPGTPYDSSRPSSEQHTDCSYTYRRSSASAPNGAFTATATATWHVTWTAAGAAGGGDLGNVSRTTTFIVRVSEIEAVNR
ncbi:MAG: hypothetical protein QOK28_3341 [Actinomycetota bacterium]